MKHVNFTTFILILAVTLTGPLAWSAPPSNPPPGSAIDDWDDDVWSNWGNDGDSEGNPNGGDIPPDDLNPNANANSNTPPPPTFTTRAEESGVHFRLVRRGDEGPKGARKSRPNYGRRAVSRAD